ncbi:unnamed protein product [Timema podura]|uniref:Uncharacterized protein n=1 Tax=Timema podura TaxID=61482 RepID=A0ABN7P0D8_TIMPD|nr:unnamed protein product [Timema podura]
MSILIADYHGLKKSNGLFIVKEVVMYSLNKKLKLACIVKPLISFENLDEESQVLWLKMKQGEWSDGEITYNQLATLLSTLTRHFCGTDKQLFLTDKKKLNFLYGKWTEFIRCTDVISYEEYMRKNVHKFRREGDGKGKCPTPNESPLHNPKTVLSKLNSLKVSPFKSSSQAEQSMARPVGGTGMPAPSRPKDAHNLQCVKTSRVN